MPQVQRPGRSVRTRVVVPFSIELRFKFLCKFRQPQLREIGLFMKCSRLIQRGWSEIPLQRRIISNKVPHALLRLIPLDETHREPLTCFGMHDVTPLPFTDQLGCSSGLEPVNALVTRYQFTSALVENDIKWPESFH